MSNFLIGDEEFPCDFNMQFSADRFEIMNGIGSVEKLFEVCFRGQVLKCNSLTV